MGFNVLARPAVVEFHADEMECRQSTSIIQESRQDQEQREPTLNNIVSAAANLKLKIPSYDVADESEGDGCKTPTSCDQKIPSSPPCPPAPKKPKAILSRKRKSCLVTGNTLDLSREIECLFPAPLLLDLYGKVNKVRRGNNITTPTTTTPSQS